MCWALAGHTAFHISATELEAVADIIRLSQMNEWQQLAPHLRRTWVLQIVQKGCLFVCPCA